ncbi:MAG: hypothetical protein A2946_02525 [Candidatus Liptonbacteria bacterium RIFCSPLOWO2_01_FULL_53_13]|uniref:Uncharacterized protein n=1 Tax=Candidatus Liptonbacteria bacterium RIFCSPLOWO2_01_FULL_53_13 TaxID=1798651 RepID=A0A1G2CLS4_9BACT|nr:MAG: hypothetical protein A2946_02525 [Candidatus Liptonbacteria bacterium RIFCSPLOWO2_01_FULL_53_13]
MVGIEPMPEVARTKGGEYKEGSRGYALRFSGKENDEMPTEVASAVSDEAEADTWVNFAPIPLGNGDTLTGHPETGRWLSDTERVPLAPFALVGWHGPRCKGVLARDGGNYFCLKCAKKKKSKKFVRKISCAEGFTFGEWRKRGARKFGKREG